MLDLLQRELKKREKMFVRIVFIPWFLKRKSKFLQKKVKPKTFVEIRKKVNRENFSTKDIFKGLFKYQYLKVNE